MDQKRLLELLNQYLQEDPYHSFHVGKDESGGDILILEDLKVLEESIAVPLQEALNQYEESGGDIDRTVDWISRSIESGRAMMEMLEGDPRETGNIVLRIHDIGILRENKGVPHVDYLDMTMLFYRIAGDGDHYISKVIDSTEFAQIGLRKMELFAIAKDNTMELFPFFMRTLNIPHHFEITNTIRTDGAISMLYDNGLRLLADQYETDVIIYPVSEDYIIAVPYLEEGDDYRSTIREKYQKEFRELRQAAIEEGEIPLSDKVHIYGRETGGIAVVEF